MTYDRTINLKPCIFLFLTMMGLQAPTLTTQSKDLRVEFTDSGNPTVKIYAERGCNHILKGRTTARTVRSCSTNRQTPPVKIEGICTKEGAKLCLNPDFLAERCATIIVDVYNQDFTLHSSKINLSNISFFNASARLTHTSWNHQGNTSTLILRQPPGIASSKLELTAKSPRDKSITCPSAGEVIEGEVRQGLVHFTADWSSRFKPDCEYNIKFVPMNDCDKPIIKLRRKLPPLQYWMKNPEKPAVKWPNTNVYWTAGVMAVLVVVLAAVLVLLYRRRRRLRGASPAPAYSITLLEQEDPLVRLRPVILLVYTPCLHQEMAALSTQLQDLTGLQIEDLYGVGQDKFSDPTVWLTRRLMDSNTRFVLAVSTTTASLTQHDGPKENPKQGGGALGFLYDHFLQHLQMTSLAYDYTRLHQVRFETQADAHLNNVTPSRLYRLPAHLNQLAHNLASDAPFPLHGQTNRSL